VLGDTFKSSFTYWGKLGRFRADGHIGAPPNPDELTEHHKAVIAVYPWEADHIKKAKEMRRRGAPVSEPLGKIFLDDMEFAVFQWFPGITLLHSENAGYWEAYGRVVRFCHDNGIALEDVAGRNAIWTGKDIRLINFEHVWLKKRSVPLTGEEREPSLERIREERIELGTPKALDAFMRGYNKKGS
jgi:hypothetical protein